MRDKRREQNQIWVIVALAAVLGMTLARIAHAQAMPDRKLTPGATNNLTAKQLCNPKFHTGAVRDVSDGIKREVYLEYRMCDHHGACARGCEIDHLISLELGGSNDIRNLWPEPYSPEPNAHQKDLVENWLHRQVCAGKLTLDGAQHLIATDWFAVYRRMGVAQEKAVVKSR